MPNWCLNVTIFRNEDPEQLEKVALALREGKLMQTFHPCPEELLDDKSTTYGGDGAEEQDKLRANLTEKYGVPNWYEWRIENWGTKWDCSECSEAEADLENHMVEVSFDTAWGPPVKFYQYMESLGWKIEAYYYEPGQTFCGQYKDGVDDSYDIDGDAEWVKENIPEDIDDMFGISENMEPWEDDEDDDSDT